MKFLKYVSLSINNFRYYCNNSTTIMKYLHVAEKNDAAKNIAAHLSRGTARRREGLSKYNKIYEFDGTMFNQNVKCVMTSVSGHLLNFAFTINFKNWKSCNPAALFDAPVIKGCTKDGEQIKKTLEREIQSCEGLVIWTDCDREGENIGFEIIKVCQEKKPNIRIYRAKFSEITAASVFRALNNLEQPNKNVSLAVDVRQEMDLRTGAAFTRLQTLHLSRVFPEKLSDKLISYGSCQFPTLGFVVERFKDIETFIPEPFWKIKMSHTKDNLTVDYTWERERLFAKPPCESILDILQENLQATVESIISKPKSKWRPVPLDTVEMEKTISRKLKINAKETMRIAERLYTQGFISYPRTETNIFPKELNLQELVVQQTADQRWGDFATRIINDGGPNPRQGKKTDQAHPPIHPTKHAPGLHANEKVVYEYIVRHFLACCSKDALGHETIVKVDIAEEKFTAKGLVILERNYLDVYPYDKWTGKEIHSYQNRETFMPSVLEMVEGNTTAPKLLTEADLIALMEKHGIGTDATHADHIDTIKTREYVGLHENIYFVPGTLGMGLVEGYDNIDLGVSLAKPILRSEFEADLKLICDGLKDPKVVRREQIDKYRTVFENVVQRMHQLEEKLAVRIAERRNGNIQGTETLSNETFKPVLKCPRCGNAMIIRKRKDETGLFLTCCGYPACKNAVWFPGFVDRIDVMNDTCPNCGPEVKKLKVKFKTGQNPFFDENPKVLCVGGCDMMVMETFDIALSSVIKTNDPAEAPLQPRPPPASRGRPTNSTRLTNSTRPTNTTRPINSTIPPNSTRPTNSTISPNSTRPANSTRPSNSTRPPNSTKPTNNVAPRVTNSTNTTTPTNRNNTVRSPRTGPNDAGSSSTPWIQPNRALQNGTMPNNRPTNSTANNLTRNDETFCNCGTIAVLLIVKKEGPNTGRQFYKCQKGRDGGGCDFFLWADAVQPPLPPQQNTNSSQNLPPQPAAQPSSSTATVVLHCNCGQQAIMRTVHKEGGNKGRQFYVCPGAMETKCSFFKWAEDVGNLDDDDGGWGDGGGGGGGGYGGGRGFGGGRGHRGGTKGRKNSWGKRGRKSTGTKRKAPRSQSTSGKTRRRCGICGEEGHIRTNCPNASRH